MKTLFLIGVIPFLIFLIKMGVMKSFSHSYFKAGWWFRAVLLLVVFTLTPCMLEVTKDPFQVLAFLSVAMLGFVAVAPDFTIPKSQESKVHKFFAIASGVVSLLWVIAVASDYGWWLLLIPLLTSIGGLIMINRQPQNITYWAEMPAFAWTLITLFILTYK